MNYAAMTIQRRDDWVAAVRGFSRYLVSHESYADANRYGRYINFGQLEIMGSDGQSRAFSHDGWDWNRWPGTTTVQLPWEALRAKLRNVDRFSGLEEMLLSEQRFAGGISNGHDGLFAMKLQGHPKYDASLAANKSVFFFDDRIVALGSGIRTQNKDYPTQTTLFQHAIRQPDDRVWLNTQRIEPGQTEATAPHGMMNVLVDPDQNAYFVPGRESVQIALRAQHSRNHRTSAPTEGTFATAVINHGKAPSDAGYEYAVLVHSDAGRTRQFAQQLQSDNARPYIVKRRDNQAHVVWDRKSQTTGYAIFEPETIFAEGLLAEVAAPALVMLRETGQQLHVSLVNPDLNLYQGKDTTQYREGVQQEVSIYSRLWKDSRSQPVTNTLWLNGQWRTAGALPSGWRVTTTAEGKTQVRFTTVDAAGVQLELTRI